MPPNVAARLNPFRRQRDLSERFDMSTPNSRLGSIYARDAAREPAPIVSLSVGSAGMHRTALWVKKMTALGCVSRIQSLVVYDCNDTNIRLWKRAARNSGLDHLTITPSYLPLTDGFLRQPDFFQDYYGAIERDIESIVDQMERRSNEAGTRPQVIIEWMGFGGHARLSYLIHEHVADRFPNAKFLPVFCIPSERVLEQNIRDYDLWNEGERIIGAVPSLITDNRAAGSLQTLDERVALGLASMEACYRFRPESGTIAETISMFTMQKSRWLSLETVDLPYRAHRERPRRAEKVTHEDRMAHSAVVQSIKEAVWRLAEPANDEQHTGYFKTPAHDAEQRIYVVLPFNHLVVEGIEEDVEDQLQREAFNGPFPGTKVAFAAGNALWRNDQEKFAYGHVCKLVGMTAGLVPPSIDRIIREDGDFRSHRRRVLSKGEKKMLELGIPLSQTYDRKDGSTAPPEQRRNGHDEAIAPEQTPPERNGFDHEDLGQGTGELIRAGAGQIAPA